MKIDIFCHIVPKKYKEALDKVSPYYQKRIERVPTLFDLERRFRIMDKYEDLRQVLTISSFV